MLVCALGCTNRADVLEDSGLLPDVPLALDASGPDAPPDSPLACAGLGCGMVDILFVVDSSISMGSAQRGLAEAFPRFFSEITERLEGTDFHLMVTDTDGAGYELICARLCPAAGEHAVLGEDQGICAGFPCDSITDRGICDSTLGAGVVYPVGDNASNRDCDFPEGRRYLTSSDADLEERFLCSAAVGALGDGNERPVGAVLSALEVETRPGGCSEGFLRDDALLVVVIVSDAGSTAAELDSTRVGEWHDRLLALKCGREEGVVMITVTHDGSETAPWYSSLIYQEQLSVQWHDYCLLVPGDPCCCTPTCPEDPPDPLCFPGKPPRVCAECASEPPPWEQCWFFFTGYGTPLVRLAESFGSRGVHREICSDFGDVLDEALDTIDTACTVF